METESSPPVAAACASRASAALLCQELLCRRLYRCLDAQTRQRLPFASASFGRLYHPRRFVRSLSLATRASAETDEEARNFLSSFPKLRRLTLPVSPGSAELATNVLAALGGQLRSVTLVAPSGVKLTKRPLKAHEASQRALQPPGFWNAYAALLKALPRGLVALHLHWGRGHQPQQEWPEEVLGEAVAFLRQAHGLRLLCLQGPALALRRLPADLFAHLRALRTRNCCFDCDKCSFFEQNGEELPRLCAALLRLSTAPSLSMSLVMPQTLTTLHLRVAMWEGFDESWSFLSQLGGLRHLALSIYEEWQTPIGGHGGGWTLGKADVPRSLPLHSLSVRVVNLGCEERPVRVRLHAPASLRHLRITSTSSRGIDLHTAPLLLRKTVFPQLRALRIEGCRLLRGPHFDWEEQFPALERLELAEAALPLDLEVSAARDPRPRPDLCLTQPLLFQHLARWERNLAL